MKNKTTEGVEPPERVVLADLDALELGTLQEAGLSPQRDHVFDKEMREWYPRLISELRTRLADLRDATLLIRQLEERSDAARAAAGHVEEAGEVCVSDCLACNDPVNAVIRDLHEARREAFQRGRELDAVRASLDREVPGPRPLLAEKVAQAATAFCSELQEDAEGVPQSLLSELNATIDAWEALSIETVRLEESRAPRRKKPQPILVTYCPFCGTRVAPAVD
jgi:hypothetical protein